MHRLKYVRCSLFIGKRLLTYTLREHLYRRHLLPRFKCPRCCQPFDGPDDLHAHQRSDTPCALQMESTVEGITEGQERKLRAQSPNAKTEGQRWIDVYRILFPDDDPSVIPSPCKSFFISRMANKLADATKFFQITR